MKQPEKTILNGREIEYNDVIHHHTDTHFDWKDRIKILFTGRCRIHSEIYTMEVVNVRGSRATVYIPPIIKRRNTVVGLAHNGKDFQSQKQ